MPSLVTWSEYVILLVGGVFAIGIGIGAAIYHMFRK